MSWLIYSFWIVQSIKSFRQGVSYILWKVVKVVYEVWSYLVILSCQRKKLVFLLVCQLEVFPTKHIREISVFIILFLFLVKYILLIYKINFTMDWFTPGCCIGHGFHETHPTWSYHGEAVIIPWKLWKRPAVLYSDFGWSCTFTRCSREASERKPTRRSLQDKRQWPLPILLKATITAQNFGWNCENSLT